MKNLLKKVVVSVVIILLVTTVVACSKSKEKVKLSFETNGGSSIADIEKVKGESFSKPSNPTKTDADFVDWYLNSSLTNVVVWPLVLEDNQTIYAKWEGSISYEIVFNVQGGGSTTTLRAKEGTLVTRPEDPTHPQNIFFDWFTTPLFENIQQFPIVASENKTVYGQMLTPKEWFIKVRDNTFKNTQYEFEYNYEVNLSIGGLKGPSGIRNGLVSHNAANSEAQYYEHNQDTGTFFVDGEEYVVAKNTDKKTYKINNKGKLVGIDSTVMPTNDSFYSTSFAKLLFEYGEDDFDVTRNNTSLSINFKSKTAVLGVLTNILNSPLVNSLINGIPSTGTSLEVSVQIANNKITQYHYNFSINASAATLSFAYDLTVLKVGSGVVITLPTFPNTSINQEDINVDLAHIKESIDNVFSGTVSGYNYSIKTAVDEGISQSNPFGAAINSTTAGRTIRKIEEGNIYFWNRTKFDSDYKNGNTGLVDYELYRAITKNKEVYDVKDGILSNPYLKLDEYNNESIDQYYGFILLSLIDVDSTYVTVVEKTTSNNKTTYSIALNSEGVKLLLEYYDEVIRVNGGTINVAGTGTNLEEILIYKISSDFAVSTFSLEVVVNNNNNEIEKLDLSTKGTYIQQDSNKLVDWKLTVLLNDFNKITSYTIPNTPNNIDLSNS
jgi:hypothetical protein